MKITYRGIAVLFGILFSINAIGQADLQIPTGTVTLGNFAASNSVYTSTGSPVPTTSLTPASGQQIHLYIDNSIPGNVNYVTQLSTDFTQTINTSLPVGKILSSYGVSQSGASNYNVPIITPPGTMAMAPKLSITYNSQSPEGLIGYGWNLSGLSCVSRLGQTPYHNYTGTYPDQTQAVTLTNSDWFALDGNRLITTSGINGTDGTTYATESETFNLVTSYSTYGNGPDHFVVVTKDGLTMEYGNTTDSKLIPIGLTTPTVFMWFVDKITDQFGNYMTFHYMNNNGEARISEIDYTGNQTAGFSPYNSIIFTYGLKTDANTVYVAGGALNSTVVLNNIVVNCHGSFFAEYFFKYAYNTYSLLQEIDQMAADHSTLNPLLFSYGSDDVTSSNFPEGTANTGDVCSLLSNTSIGADLGSTYYSGDLGFIELGNDEPGITAVFQIGNYTGSGKHDVVSYLSDWASQSYDSYSGDPALTYTKLFTQNSGVTFSNSPTSGSSWQNKLPYLNTAAGYLGTTTMDFNGDGKDDYYVSTFNITGGEGSDVEEDVNISTNITDPTPTYNTLATYNMNYCPGSGYNATYGVAHQYGPQGAFLSGTFYLDMNGDGQMDVFNYHYDPIGENEYYRVWINASSASISGAPTTSPNFEISVTEPKKFINMTHEEECFCTAYNYGHTWLDFSNAFPMDLYGDGREELVNVLQWTSGTDSQKVVLSFNANQVYGQTGYTAKVDGTPGTPGSPGNGIVITPDNSNLNYNTNIYTSTNIQNTGPYVLFGDFNGDGISDVLTFSSAWTLNTGKGDGNYVSTSVASELPTDNPFSYPSVFYYAEDVNGDGKTDILEFIPNAVPVKTTIKVYYSTGTSFIAGDPITVDGTNVNPLTWQVSFADFNGDGVNDVLLEKVTGDGNYNGPPQLIFFYSGTNSKHMAEAVDGYDKSVQFSYGALSDNGHYGESLANGFYGTPSFPANLIEITPPMYVVTSMKSPDGTGGNTHSTTNYYYQDAIYSPEGLGFLGFLQQTSSNNLTNFITTNNYTVLSPFNNLVPSTSGTTVYYTPSISDDSYTYTPYSLGGLRYFLPLTQKVHNDDIAGTTTTTNYTYVTGSTPLIDLPVNYGNIAEQTSEVSVTSTASVIESSDIQTTYTTSATWIPASVLTNTTTVTRTGNSAYTRVTDYNWDAYGHLLSTVQDPITSPLPYGTVTTTYTYETNTGVLLSQSTGSDDPNCLTINTSSTYDPFFQFKISSTNPLGQVTKYQYDARWGSPTKVTTPDGLISYTIYDVYGRPVQTITPDGLQQNFTYNWALSSDFPLGSSPPFDIGPSGLNTALYKVNIQKTGSPSATVYYDWFDRAIGSASDGFNSTIYSVKSYTQLGQTYQSSEPYENGGLAPVVSTNSYTDDFHRLTETDVWDNLGADPVLTTTYTYTPNTSLGTMTNSIYKPDGTSSSQTTDPTGALVNSTDYVYGSPSTVYSSVDYTYFSNGHVSFVTLNGNTINSFTYDILGRQTNMMDVNFGGGTGYIYSNNAYNQLMSQTDPNGDVYTMAYDVLGRITSKISSAEGTYTYNYVTSGNGLNMIHSQVGPTGTISYTYDHLNRPSSLNINGLVTSYKYDAFSNVIGKNFPGGFGISNSYDSKGYPTQTNRSDNGALIWQANYMNALGQYTQYTLGNGVQTQKTFSPYGFLKIISAGNYENMDLDFDPTNGNLKSRVEKDFINNHSTNSTYNLTESFQYDPSLNSRLVNATSTYPHTSANTTVTMNYDQNGNIVNKSDICAPSTNYTNANSNNQVTEVPNSNSVINPDQLISYTSFNAPLSMTHSNYNLAFIYGPDNNREQTVLTNSTTGEITTRYYAGDYEKTLFNSSLQSEVNYIKCGGELVAMYVNQPSGADLYYVYSDHLGSILTVTNGTNTYNQSFDAWGNYRNPSDGSSVGIPTNPSWMYRGFTGHEHLPEFQLINANGRLYDPLINSMLSPDPFVQNSTNTQNFNHYSYCLNNPLKYSDPSGFRTIGNANVDQPSFDNSQWNAELNQNDENVGNAAFLGGGSGESSYMNAMASGQSTFGYNMTSGMGYVEYSMAKDAEANDRHNSDFAFYRSLGMSTNEINILLAPITVSSDASAAGLQLAANQIAAEAQAAFNEYIGGGADKPTLYVYKALQLALQYPRGLKFRMGENGTKILDGKPLIDCGGLILYSQGIIDHNKLTSYSKSIPGFHLLYTSQQIASNNGLLNNLQQGDVLAWIGGGIIEHMVYYFGDATMYGQGPNATLGGNLGGEWWVPLNGWLPNYPNPAENTWPTIFRQNGW